MKKAIMISLTFVLCLGALAGCGKNAVNTTFTTSSAADPVSTEEHAFTAINLSLPEQETPAAKSSAIFLSDEELEMLLALQFDDYRHMKISEFQNKVWELTDTPEYRALLNRLFQNESLYALRDSDETAAFLFYVLNPLTKEKWQSHIYSNAAYSESPASVDSARLEYTYTMTILNADIMVKDYCDMCANVADAMNSMMLGRMKEELQSEDYMLTEIKTFVDGILPDFQTPELTVAIEYAYFPLSAAEEDVMPDCGTEHRIAPNGTESDYRSLMALKTAGYEDMPLADFNAALLAWADEDYERMERIDEDDRFDDFKVPLSEDERSFVERTVFLSGKENGRYVQSVYNETPENDPWHDQYLNGRFGASGDRSGYCSLYYRFFWHIPDKKVITVGERDRQISGMMKAVQEFWDKTGTEELLKMSKADIVAKLNEIMSAYSTNNITITTSEDHVQFENIE